MGHHDPSPRGDGRPHHPLVGALEVETELDQEPAAAGEAHVVPAHHRAEQGRVGRPDLLSQAQGRKVGGALEVLQQQLEGDALPLELAVDRGRAGQVRQQQVWRGDYGADALVPETQEGVPALVGGSRAVVHRGNEMAVQIDEVRTRRHTGE